MTAKLKTYTLGCKVNQYETEYVRQGLARRSDGRAHLLRRLRDDRTPELERVLLVGALEAFADEVSLQALFESVEARRTARADSEIRRDWVDMGVRGRVVTRQVRAGDQCVPVGCGGLPAEQARGTVAWLSQAA